MFKAVHYGDVVSEEVEDSKGVNVRRLITEDDGAENFTMRLFDVESGGQTAFHSHDWEHEVFILGGKGLVVCGGSEAKVAPGYAVFVPPNVEHCFRNIGEEKLSFLCLIPYRKQSDR